ncbi:MAG: hypothetical protein ABIG89_03220 [Candidatus Woesearchaeota archaeon]
MIRKINPLKSEITPDNNMEPKLNVSSEIPFSDVMSSVELLDSIMTARDEVFDKQLNDDLKAHRKLASLLMK